MTGLEQAELYEALKLAVEEMLNTKSLKDEQENIELMEFINNFDFKRCDNGQD